MSWRVVMVSKPSKLDYSMGYLAVRDTETTNKVYLSEISVLIIENTACSVTVALLSKLLEKKIKVIFCDEKRNPCGELVPFYGSHDTSRKLRRQIRWEENAKQAVWTRIVGEKIQNQGRLLRRLGLEEYRLLEGYRDELEFNDVTNREGHAAKVYFNALFGKDFSRDKDCAVNAALNYGYSLLLSAVNREICANGYLTQLGIFHDNVFNQFNLSCDLMEPFRPLVDHHVKTAEPRGFGKEEKSALLNLLNREVTVDGNRSVLLHALELYTRSVLDAIDHGEPERILFPEIRYEL